MREAEKIRALEEKLLNGNFRRNRDAVADLLAEDFREFGSSGRVWSKQEILDQPETEKPFDAEIEDFQTTELAAGTVLATYRATIHHPGVEPAISLRSSIWIDRGNRWQMLFHQGKITTRS